MDLLNLEKKLNYHFKNEKILTTAFTHSSFAYSHHEKSNERLEFLGDGILNFVVTDFLFRTFDYDEGNLSKLKAYLVSADYLSKIVDKLELINYLKSENFNPKNSKNVKCDLFESVIGAIYQDSNFTACEEFILEQLSLEKENVIELMHQVVDYKTKFQELVQQSGKNTIEYVLVKKSGTSHQPLFTIALKVDGKTITTQSEKSKKLAESMCAKVACEIYNK